MPPTRTVLMLAGMVLFIGTLWSAAGASIHLSGVEVRAQDLGMSRIHMPVVVRDALVTGGLSKPAPWRPDADFVLGGPAWTVDVVGTVAYVGVGAHLMAYDIAGEAPLTLLGASPPLPGNVRDVVVSDGFAFAAVHQTTPLEEAPGGLFVLDVRDPTAIDVVAARELRGGATDLDLYEDRVVVTAMSEHGWWPAAAFAVFDVSNPRQPDLIRLAPSGGFSAEGAITLRDAIVFTCVNGLSAYDMSRPIDSWLVERDLAPCVGMDRVGSDALLAVVSDSEDPRSNTPMLRIFDMRDISMIELIGETPLDALGDSNARINVLEVRAVGSSVYVTALIDQSQGGIVQFDVADPTSPLAVASWSGEGPILSVDSDGGPIVVGLATDVGFAHDFARGPFDPETPYALGSRIEVLEDVGDGSLRSLATVDGPGTLLTTVACHDATAYVFELSTRDSGIDRLWAFDTSGDMPTVSAIMDRPEWEQRLGIGAPGVVASSSGLFVLNLGGQISRYQVSGGRFEFMGTVADEGALAVSGDNLFVLARNGKLRMYDFSVPDSWRLVAEQELPRLGGGWLGAHSMIASNNRLWMASDNREPSSTIVILADISDIPEISLVGTLELATESREPEYAWLREGDGEVWLLTTEPNFDYWTTITTLSAAPDGSGPVLDARWSADTTPESAGFPWALAVLKDRAWYLSPYFLHGEGAVHAVERTATGELQRAASRAAPAAVRGRSTSAFDDKSDSLGSLSLATCGDRILGTDIEGGLYGIDPERWLEGAGDQ